jgi:hypothetical protein
MNNNHRKTPEEIYKSNRRNTKLLLESKYDFVLKDDPLVPIKTCTVCGYHKGFIVYTYKRWEEHSKKLSHFGMIRCNLCGSAITWIPRDGRNILIKKHNIDL